jgi:uncharacterized membrane protein YfcA
VNTDIARTFAALNATNEAILYAKSHEELYEKVCEAAFSSEDFLASANLFARPRDQSPATSGSISWAADLYSARIARPISLFAPSGMGSGVTSMIAHAGTPPFQFYVMPKELDRDMYIGTSVLFFAATNLMKAPAFLALGQLSGSQLKTSLIFFPLAMAASWLGVRLVRR